MLIKIVCYLKNTQKIFCPVKNRFKQEFKTVQGRNRLILQLDLSHVNSGRKKKLKNRSELVNGKNQALNCKKTT